MTKRRVRLISVVVMALVATSCGARLTPSQRAAGVGALGGAGGNGGSDAVPGDSTQTDPGQTIAPTSGPGGSVTTGGGTLAPVPAGGNGGATDIGVTSTQITIASVADVTGVQSGLFKSAHQATTALAAYINSQGGIYGRTLKPLLLDSKIDPVANQAAVADACQKAFALVGSMSAADDGGAATGAKCGIPDMSAITVNGVRTKASNSYPAYPVRPDWFLLGPALYVKEKFPDVLSASAVLYLNTPVTKATALQRVEAMSKIGYTFVYKQEVSVLEANYAPFVNELQSNHVQYVTMVADYRSIAKLLSAMKAQGYQPKVRDWDSVVYDKKFLKVAGAAAEGSHVYLNTALFEEDANNPEMRLYEQWLQRVSPGAAPDYFGLYAWSAGRLFVQAATAAGPRLTRAKLFAALKGIHAWNDNGLHTAADTGNRLASSCFLYAVVRGGKFVRETPSSGWDCTRGPLVRTSEH